MNLWFVVWAVWLAVGMAWEANGLIRQAKDDTLTEFSRTYVLHTRVGSMMVGGFLFWLVLHWLFVVDGVSWWDLFFVWIGVVVGLTGWHVRKAVMERRSKKDSP